MRKPKGFERAQRTLGANMKRIRAKRGLTQVAAGERAGLHWRHWQKIEAGEINVCLSSIVGIAAGLETTISELFAEQEGAA